MTTKLEELKAVADAAYVASLTAVADEVAWEAAHANYAAAWDAYCDEVEILCVSGRRSGKSYALAAWVAYQEELKKLEENSDDH